MRSNLTYVKYKAKIACREPFFYQKNIKARFQMAQTSMTGRTRSRRKLYRVMKQKLIFLYLMGGNMFAENNGTRFYPRNLTPTVKHGDRRIMLWGFFYCSGRANYI